MAHCELYKFNDPKIPECFVKNAVRKLQKMVADLRAQLAEKDMLVVDLRAQLADKDMLLLHMGMLPDSEIGAENDALPEEKVKEQAAKEVKEKVAKEKAVKVKLNCCFPKSAICALLFIVIAWCINSRICLTDVGVMDVVQNW